MAITSAPRPLPAARDDAAGLDRLEGQSVYYHTERLAMRPFSLVDAWPLWEATRASRFNEHLLWPQPTHVDEVFERAEAIAAEARLRRLGALSVATRSVGAWVALVRLMPAGGGRLELGLWTHPDYWSGGWSTEITRLAVAAAFEQTSAAVLTARSHVDNAAAHRVLEKAGFSRYAEPRTISAEHGAPMPTAYFRLARGQWRRADEVSRRAPMRRPRMAEAAMAA